MKNKKKLSKLSKVLIYTYNLGYRIDENGDLYCISDEPNKPVHIGNRGYIKFTITHPEIREYPVFIHRLQAYQKYGDKIFEKGVQVRHLDGCQTNNKKENIVIGTQSNNMMDRPEKQRKRLAKKAGRAKSSLSIKDVIDIREMRKKGCSYSEILREYDIAKSTLSYICNYKTWKNV